MWQKIVSRCNGKIIIIDTGMFYFSLCMRLTGPNYLPRSHRYFACLRWRSLGPLDYIYPDTDPGIGR